MGTLLEDQSAITFPISVLIKTPWGHRNVCALTLVIAALVVWATQKRDGVLIWSSTESSAVKDSSLKPDRARVYIGIERGCYRGRVRGRTNRIQ